MSGRMKIISPCYIHHGYFMADPDNVVSVLVDPQTGKPPDVDPHPDGLGMDRAIQAVICDDCVREVNKVKIRRGEVPIETASIKAARLG